MLKHLLPDDPVDEPQPDIVVEDSPILHRMPLWSSLLVIGFSLSLLMVNLGQSRVLTLHEVFAAQPAKEMVNNGNWITPHFCDAPRLKKPPGMSWLIALSMKAFDSRSELVVRLPSVVSAVITVWLVALITTRWFGTITGLTAGLMQGATVFVWIQGRLAEADMPLCAVTTAAMVIFDRATHSPDFKPERRYFFAAFFYLLLAASVLLKFVMGPVIILGGCGLYSLLRGFQHKQWQPMRFLLTPIGISVFLACVISYIAAVYRENPSAFDIWQQQILERANGGMGGQKPFFFYLYTTCWLLLPWTVFVILAIVRSNRSWLRPRGQFLICWVLPTALALQLASFKHAHYLVPILPPFVIAAAVGLLILLRYRKTTETPGILPPCAICMGIGIAVTFVIWHWQPRIGSPATAITWVISLGLVGLTIMAKRPKLGLQLTTIFSMSWICAAIFFLWIMPNYDSYRVHAEFARRASGYLPEDQPIYLLGLGECQIAYYLPDNTSRVDWVDELFKSIKKSPEKAVYVIGQHGHLSGIPETLKVEQLREAKPRKKETDAQQLLLVKCQLQPIDNTSHRY